jgi:hypothetical protein
LGKIPGNSRTTSAIVSCRLSNVPEGGLELPIKREMHTQFKQEYFKCVIIMFYLTFSGFLTNETALKVENMVYVARTRSEKLMLKLYVMLHFDGFIMFTCE